MTPWDRPPARRRVAGVGGRENQASAGVRFDVPSAWTDLMPRTTRAAAFRTSGSLSVAAAPRATMTVVRETGASPPNASTIRSLYAGSLPVLSPSAR